MTSVAAAVVSQRLREFKEGIGHVPGADLLGHNNIHQPHQKGHGHEDDHDGAVGAEDLIEVVRGQKAGVAGGGHGLLGAHQHGVGRSRAAA